MSPEGLPVHGLDIEELPPLLRTPPDGGLSEEEVVRRRERFGENRLMEAQPLSWWQIFLRQFKGAMVYLLLAAALISLSLREWLDAGAIVVVIIVNGLIGFATEYRAEKAVDALKKMTTTRAKVLRGGKLFEVDGETLVPGDILVIEAGDVIAADARLLEASRLAVDESSLTGESVPVDKYPGRLEPSAGLADRINCVHAGSAVVKGTGRAIVFATAMETEIGRISKLLVEVEEGATPLEERLERFTGFMIRGVLAVAVLVFGLGAIQGRGLMAMVQTGIALAVAAVPEGLPIVATMALAFGVARMARLKALVRHLSSVETLGSTTVICTDKTGTITLNEMTVVEEVLLSQRVKPLVHQVSVLCNNANLDGAEGVGDPMEIALLRRVAEAGDSIEAIRKAFPRLQEEPFDSTTMRMVTHHGAGRAIKGAPERLLGELQFVHDGAAKRPMTDEDRTWWLAKVEELARKGMRTLAFAWGEREEEPALLGLVAIVDPPRPEVAEAVAQSKAAGIHSIMVTGDHLVTAQAIALQIGLSDGSDEVLSGSELEEVDDGQLAEVLLKSHVIARVVPEQKLRIVKALQQAGEVVAMTGDGVNDAVALKQADVGIAMGIQGTEVSKEASDIILQDDRFATIIQAVAEGRRIFANINKSILFLVSCNLSEILTVLISILLRLPSVLLPLQILWINLVTDVLPALSLSLDPSEPMAMKRPPRRREENLLTRNDVKRMVLYGLTLGSAAIGCYLAFMRLFPDGGFRAREAAFHALVLGQLLSVFNVRQVSLIYQPGQIGANPGLLLGIGLSMALQILITVIPVMQKVLQIMPFSLHQWLLAFLFALLPTALIQGYKAFAEGRA